MEIQLKHLYGRRITPGVQIFLLVLIIILGIALAFTGTDRAGQRQVDRELVE